MGLAPLMLFTTTLLIVRNQRILHAWNARQEETQRRAAAGPAPENPQTAPQDPRRASPPGRPDPQPPRPRAPRPSPPARTAATTRREHALTQDKPRNQAPPQRPKTRHRTTGHGAGMSDPNVKMVPTET